MTTYDRAYLLSAAKRNDVLELWEVERYGGDSFGDPDYVSIYGLAPRAWYERGVRLLGRTVVECTRDALAAEIGRDVAAVAARAAAAGVVVLDPFAGSANTLYRLARVLDARAAVGCELDDGVFAATQRNLAIVGADVTLLHAGYDVSLRQANVAPDELVVVFVAPPWGDALDREHGLDLSRTTPPVVEVVDSIAALLAGVRTVVALQLYETVAPDSLAAVAVRFEWTSRTTYALDAPGRNQGLLLGTLGWTP